MRWGMRKPSFRKSFAARTSWKRYVRHSLGLKAPRGWGWLTNPKKAAYNRIYNRTTFGWRDLFRTSRRRRDNPNNSGLLLLLGLMLCCCGCPVLFSPPSTQTPIATSPRTTAPAPSRAASPIIIPKRQTPTPADELKSAESTVRTGLESSAESPAAFVSYREWKKAAGGPVIRAAFLEYAAGVVVLETEMREKVEFPINALSEVDQAWVYAKFKQE